MGEGQRRREAEASGLDRVGEQCLHVLYLFGRGLALAVRTDHVASNCGVPDQKPGVDGELAIECIQIIGEGLPAPRHALGERARGMPSTFDIISLT